MTPARVGVIGAGIAGPVLATLLKLKGYDPVVFERNEGVSDAGLGLGCVLSSTTSIRHISDLAL